MSYEDGWAALNLEMPARVPRVEFDAERHWPLVNAVTGSNVGPESPEAERLCASVAFMRAWNYDINLTHNLGNAVFGDHQTSMGHATYEDGGGDFVPRGESPFKTPEDVLAFDPRETFGPIDADALARGFDAHYRETCETYPDMVNTSGVYVTLMTGLTYLFGWEMLLLAAGTDPEGFGDLAERYASWMQQYYDAIAASEVPVVYSHDDLVWKAGPFLRPDWYRRYVFPNLKRYWAPLLEAGKKVVFICDGNYTEFIDDAARAGASGFFLEVHTDMRKIAERYGKTHFFIGNADTRVLLSGTREDIRAEVERCMVVGKSCPGFIMGVTNMIPANTPVENALYYNQVYEELSRR